MSAVKRYKTATNRLSDFKLCTGVPLIAENDWDGVERPQVSGFCSDVYHLGHCLQSCSGVEADVRLARLERLRNGDRPQTSRRVPATLQTLWLLLFRSACLWGAAGRVRRPAVQQDFEQLNSHTPYTSPSTVLSIAILPSETTHARQTAANTKQSHVHKKTSLHDRCTKTVTEFLL